MKGLGFRAKFLRTRLISRRGQQDDSGSLQRYPRYAVISNIIGLPERSYTMIPDYQTLMLPLLTVAGDAKEHRISDVIEPLAKQFGLTDAEMVEMLPSGKQTIFSNRVHWAKTYMSQAKLLEITRRAHFRITERGRDVLREVVPVSGTEWRLG
jgi:hypothetical protein